MNLLFITGNAIKFEVAQRVFKEHGLKLEQHPLELPEIQSNSNEEIAQFSAQYAFNQVQKPLMVTDVGFFMPALSGFPGPYIKYLNQTLTVDDFVRLMDGKSDRRVIIKETVCYIENKEKVMCFSEETECLLAEKPQGQGTIMDQMLILPGYGVPQSLLSKDQVTEFFKSQLSHYNQLAEYLSK